MLLVMVIIKEALEDTAAVILIRPVTKPHSAIFSSEFAENLTKAGFGTGLLSQKLLFA